MTDSDVPSLYKRTETPAEAASKLLLEWLRRVRVNIDRIIWQNGITEGGM